MSEINSQNIEPEKEFWSHATKYATGNNEDEPFVNEMAYMMVTLHRTGA